MGFNRFVRSRLFKNIMAKLYGIGAAIVLLGALFKINHYPGANIMLIVGLGTEALIFFASAFEPLPEEVDWTLVYPELAGMGQSSERAAGAVASRSVGTISQHIVRNPEENLLLSEKLDALLKSANIDANLMSSLSAGLTKLNDTAQNLNASTDILNVNANYADELSKLTESLGRLNALYTRQFETSSHQMEATAKAQENMTRIAENLAGTLESSARYKDQIADLSEKVDSLNKIYGGMLSAFKTIGKDS